MSQIEWKTIEIRAWQSWPTSHPFPAQAINFTKVSKHKRGLQATTSTTEVPKAAVQATPGNVRVRSSSVDLDSASPLPAAMEIVGAINEDGLGPVNWWPDDEEDVDPAGAPMGEEGASL